MSSFFAQLIQQPAQPAFNYTTSRSSCAASDIMGKCLSVIRRFPANRTHVSDTNTTAASPTTLPAQLSNSGSMISLPNSDAEHDSLDHRSPAEHPHVLDADPEIQSYTSNEESIEIEKSMQLIAEAYNLSVAFVGGKNEELSFQVHGRLLRYRNIYTPIRNYLTSIEGNVTAPFVFCKTCFLGEPGRANTRTLLIGTPVNCMVMVKDEEHVACGCSDGQIIVLNLNGFEKESWQAHDEEVTAIAISKEGTRLISGSLDGTVKVWGVKDHHCFQPCWSHTGAVRCIAVMEDGRRVVSGSEDGTARVWALDTGRVEPKRFRTRGGPVGCVAVLPGGEKVVAGGMDKSLRLWNMTTDPTIYADDCASFDGHQKLVRCVAVFPDGSYIVTGSDDNTVRLWNVGSQDLVTKSAERHKDFVETVAVSRDGLRIASGSRDGTIRVWDSDLVTKVCTPLLDHSSKVTGLSFLTEDRMVSSSQDGTIREWNVRRENVERRGARHGEGVTGVSFSLDGNYVVSGSKDETLRIWDSTTRQEVGSPLEGHILPVTDVAMWSGEQGAVSVVSVSEDMTVRIWDLSSRKLQYTLSGHSETICCVAVTRRGEFAVTGSYDRTVCIWNLKKMNDMPIVLRAHTARVRRVFVTDDERRIVSVDVEDKIHVWDMDLRKSVNAVKAVNAWKLSRPEIFAQVGESTVHDDPKLSIPLGGRTIEYNTEPKHMLAKMETEIWSWALSPDKKTICVGLADGQVGFLKFETQ